MKTFLHAYQNKYDWIHLVANNGIFNLYKREDKFLSTNPMLWYHPALLSFDNHADVSVFILLNEAIQFFNTRTILALLTNDNDRAAKPKWKDLREVYENVQSLEENLIPHSNILILSHPHYPQKVAVDAKTQPSAQTADPEWLKAESEDLDL